jgi:predicted nucleotidyltransferase
MVSSQLRVQTATAVMQGLVALLRDKYHVARVVLIGSLLEPDRFGPQSDIDLCVEGLAPHDYYRAVGELLTASEGFEVDLVPIERASARMNAQIRRGKVLYGHAFA